MTTRDEIIEAIAKLVNGVVDPFARMPMDLVKKLVVEDLGHLLPDDKGIPPTMQEAILDDIDAWLGGDQVLYRFRPSAAPAPKGATGKCAMCPSHDEPYPCGETGCPDE
jgi:hypothetical protein